MKIIGMLVAVEIQSVLKRYGAKLVEGKETAGYQVLEYETDQYRMVILNCGPGEIAAASGTQFLISEYHVDVVINFGVVGGLTKEMSKTKVCIVEKVVHYDFDTSAADHTEVGRYLQYSDIFIPTTQSLHDKASDIHPELVSVVCASGDRFIADPKQKRKMHEMFGADICEMEAAGIVLTCHRNQMPCMLIKCVSDGIEGGFEEFQETVNGAADLCLEVVEKIVAVMET